jgi:hypothetical protein
MGCQIQRSLTLKSLQSVGVVSALMKLIRMSGAGNVNGKGSIYQTMGVTESASAEPATTVAALIPQA